MRAVQPSPPASALSERLLGTLVRHYRIGEPLACEPLAQGLLNRGYRVVTSRGRYFLKHHLNGDPAAIARQHRATVRLGALGLPVVPPVRASDGGTVAVLGGRCFALHPWVEGQHRGGGELTPAQSRRLGALLGRVHRCLERVMAGVPRQAAGTGGGDGAPGAAALPGETTGPPPSADPWQTHELIDELLGRVRARRPRDDFDLLAERRLLQRRELLREHAHRRPVAGAEPATGWVHGDFHPLNLLYRRHGPVEPIAIVDWDRLGRQPRAEEAVRAAAIFFVQPDGTLPLAKVRAYARAYRAAAGADGHELAAAVHRVWWERLNDFWMLRWRYQLGDHRVDEQFPAQSALAVWWTRRYQAVRRAFCR